MESSSPPGTVGVDSGVESSAPMVGTGSPSPGTGGGGTGSAVGVLIGAVLVMKLVRVMRVRYERRQVHTLCPELNVLGCCASPLY